jgi:hypothetical protein
MVPNKPLSKENYLYSLYSAEVAYINKIMELQDYSYTCLGKIVVLIDFDFPNFKTLNHQKMEEIISIYENVGWEIRTEEINKRKECLLILS